MKIKILFYLLFILSISLLFTGCSNKPGKYDSFAQCLTEKGATIYGTEWCSHCQNQKRMFGKSFQYINYVDCDRNSDECLRNGIRGYPTWIINNSHYRGEQALYRLAYLTGCKLKNV